MSKTSRDSNIGNILRERGKKSAADIADVWADLDRGVNPKETRDAEDPKPTDILKKIGKKYYTYLKKTTKVTLKNSRYKRALMAGGALLVVVLFISGITKNPSNQTTETLRAVAQEQVKLPVVDEDVSLEFPILYPSNSANIQVVQVNPKGSATAYTYIDKVLDTEIRVTQQKVPESFNIERSQKLKELADSFQASSIIQIDGENIYHGYSEKGRTQSLVFVKKDLLILIASPLKLNDDVWVGYITALK